MSGSRQTKGETVPVHKTIDWTALLRRQEAASAALSEHPAPTPERERAVLKARAAELATTPPAAGAGERLDCLEFRLSGESYAVEMSFISETVPLADFTPLFCTPPFVVGITNLRGRMVSIIDLRRFFSLPVIGLSNLNRVIVVGDGTMEFGILADAVVGMTSIARSELQPPPATCTGIRDGFLAGVTAGRLALLDLAKLMSDRSIVVHEEVL
jgi:purine-binding chemotaxis protein CheW